MKEYVQVILLNIIQSDSYHSSSVEVALKPCLPLAKVEEDNGSEEIGRGAQGRVESEVWLHFRKLF